MHKSGPCDTVGLYGQIGAGMVLERKREVLGRAMSASCHVSRMIGHLVQEKRRLVRIDGCVVVMVDRCLGSCGQEMR